MDNGVLNSWKEIATYTGRGVRTVQRWEQELGFPIRRPRGKQRSAVLAIKVEIDLWLRTPHGAEAKRNSRHIHFETHKRLLNNTEVLQVRASTLVSRSEVLAQQVARAIKIGNAMKISCKAARVERKNWSAELVANSRVLREKMHRPTELGISLQNSPAPGETDR